MIDSRQSGIDCGARTIAHVKTISAYYAYFGPEAIFRKSVAKLIEAFLLL
jgi:hypothetical protein